jgi:hypothetical protein
MNESSPGAAAAWDIVSSARTSERHVVRIIIAILRGRRRQVRERRHDFGLTGEQRGCYEAIASRNGVLHRGTVAR